MRSSGQFVPVVDLSALPWLSVAQMREADTIMVEDLGISLVRMMENAGRNLAELARHLMGGDTGGQAVFLADISVPDLVYEALGLHWQTPFTRGSLVELDVWTAAKARGGDQAVEMGGNASGTIQR